MRTSISCVLLCALLPGCLPAESSESDEAEDVGSADAAIVDGSYATASMYRRAVDLGNCTGTLISARHVLTAAHCFPGGVTTGVARNYPNSPFLSENPQSFDTVYWKTGVNPAFGNGGDFTDSNNDYADIAVVQLDQPFPGNWTVAKMVWRFPSSVSEGTLVGAGNHSNSPLYEPTNTAGTLKYRSGVMIPGDDSDGKFGLWGHLTNSGDSGGPFYLSGYKLLGALHGVDSNDNNLYTSIPRHLPWLLQAIDFSWLGSSQASKRYGGGTEIETFQTSLEICQYACAQTASCDAYNWTLAGGTCELFENPTLLVTQPASCLCNAGHKP